jgi:ATP-dependent DNA helicase RecG
VSQIVSGTRASDLETDQIDFKRQPDSRPDAIRSLVDAAVCFANAGGGTIVMGVADTGSGPDALTGCDLDPRVVQRRIHELTEPPLMVGARSEEFSGQVLLVVDVFQSFEIHADKQERASYRVGTARVNL